MGTSGRSIVHYKYRLSSGVYGCMMPNTRELTERGRGGRPGIKPASGEGGSRPRGEGADSSATEPRQGWPREESRGEETRELKMRQMLGCGRKGILGRAKKGRGEARSLCVSRRSGPVGCRASDGKASREQTQL